MKKMGSEWGQYLSENNTLTSYGFTTKREDSRQIHHNYDVQCWGKLGGFLEL